MFPGHNSLGTVSEWWVRAESWSGSQVNDVRTWSPFPLINVITSLTRACYRSSGDSDKHACNDHVHTLRRSHHEQYQLRQLAAYNPSIQRTSRYVRIEYLLHAVELTSSLSMPRMVSANYNNPCQLHHANTMYTLGTRHSVRRTSLSRMLTIHVLENTCTV